MDQKAQAALAGVSDTVLIARHPRYQYFGRAYDLSIKSLEWEAGEAPSDARLAELQALRKQTSANIIIWEAAPPASAITAVDEIGLKSVVFPTLA